MFSWSVETCKFILQIIVFERLQVECVNGRGCQEYIEIDVKNIPKSMENNAGFMFDKWINIVRKGIQIEAERHPTNDEWYAKMHWKSKAYKYVEKL